MSEPEGPVEGGRAPRIAILGAGVAGICMGIRLRQAGLTSFTIFEKAEALGGTWRDNTYPGAACDVPSHLYSFSFEPKPDWSRRFGEQEEILAYLERCADDYGVRPHIRFRTEVLRADFDEEAGLWRLETREGETVEAEVLVSGVGQLSQPWYPDIPGLETFEGTVFHSARWDHDHDLRGERVAVIGNGASAIQLIPRIAPVVDELHVFQRSANWILPKPERVYPEWEKRLYARFPALLKTSRWIMYWLLEGRFWGFSKRTWLGRRLEKRALAHLHEQVSDPELRAALTPDYPLGCKRVLLADDYYPALERPNVELVTSGVERVTAEGIVTRDGKLRPVDTIICATGFQTTRLLSPMEIRGRGGVELHEAWREGPEAHLGVTVSGFPSFFLLYGPNTNLGHNSIIFMIECQVDYVLQCIRELARRRLRWMEVEAEAMRRYNDELQRELGDSVWAAGCSSWYKNEAGKITQNWSSFTAKYWWKTRRLRLDDYRMVTEGGSEGPAGP